MSDDPNSDVSGYWVAVGTAPGEIDVVPWTENYWNTSVSIGNLDLKAGTTYYVSVKAENGVGNFSDVMSSNGQILAPRILPGEVLKPEFSIGEVAGLGDLQTMKWSIYPNPAKDIVTITIDDNYSGGLIRLCDFMGRTVMTKKGVSGSISLDIGDLANGIYHLSYEWMNQRIEEKVIKH
ncbi:hypothetical protein D3C86_1615670 [compost metagenome]